MATGYVTHQRKSTQRGRIVHRMSDKCERLFDETDTYGFVTYHIAANTVIRSNNSRSRGYSSFVPEYRIKEAADLLGVSDDTLRRWAEVGRIAISTDTAGRQTVDGVNLARLAQSLGDAVPSAGDPAAANRSARNHFAGLVTKVVRDTVMAQVEIQAGPYRIVSLISREAADDLELEPGVLAVATAKATNVSIEIPRTG